jgi:hypothetical protein
MVAAAIVPKITANPKRRVGGNVDNPKIPNPTHMRSVTASTGPMTWARPGYRCSNSRDTWSWGSSSEKKKSLSTLGDRSTQTPAALSPTAVVASEPLDESTPDGTSKPPYGRRSLNGRSQRRRGEDSMESPKRENRKIEKGAIT